jgi:hypothetical protein
LPGTLKIEVSRLLPSLVGGLRSLGEMLGGPRLCADSRCGGVLLFFEQLGVIHQTYQPVSQKRGMGPSPYGTTAHPTSGRQSGLSISRRNNSARPVIMGDGVIGVYESSLGR